MLILKANSERNGAFSGDSSTNSKSFEGKVHLHRSSLSDSKDVAKLQKNSETTKDKEQKKHCHRRVAEHELNRASQQQQPIEKGILIDKVGALSTTLPSNGSSLVSAAKVQQNFETTKDKEQKKELPPVTPLGTNRRGISKAAQTILAPRPFHQEDQPTVVPGRLEMVESNPSISVAKVRRKLVL